MRQQNEYENRICSLFKEKKWWDRTDKEEKIKRCIKLFEKLNDDEIELVFNLLSKVEVIEEDKYLMLYVALLEKLERKNKNWFSNLKTIYIAPLVENANYKATKSSMTAWYILRNTRFCYHPLLNDKIIHFVDAYELNNLKSMEVIDSTSCILLVDDYIGSGNTARKALDEFTHNRSCISQLVVFSIAAEKVGLKCIKEMKVKTFCAIEVNKAISDVYVGADKDKALNLMKAIESKIFKKELKNESLGYGHSESLTIMIRTSNNVFPIFWKGKDAIFERKHTWKKK